MNAWLIELTAILALIVKFALWAGGDGLGKREVVLPVVVALGGMNRIQAETVYAFVEPEAAGFKDHLHDFRITQIDVGLTAQEIMEIILLSIDVPTPCSAAKEAHPIVWLGAVVFWVQPIEPI